MSIADFFKHLDTMASLGVFNDAAIVETLDRILTHPKALTQLHPFQVKKHLIRILFEILDKERKLRFSQIAQMFLDNANLLR